MTAQELRNNEKATKAVKLAYAKRKINRSEAEWLLSGVKI